MQVGDIVLAAVICKIQIVGLGGILGCESVDLLYYRHNAEFFAQGAHLQVGFFGVGHALFEYRACHLEVAEALLLGLAQQGGGDAFETVVAGEFVCGIEYVA